MHTPSRSKNIAEMNQAMTEEAAVKKEPKLFSESDFEDMKAKNTPTARMFVNTANLEPTSLNGKRIKIRV